MVVKLQSHLSGSIFMETEPHLSLGTFSSIFIGWSGEVLFMESVAGPEDDFTDWLQPKTSGFP